MNILMIATSADRLGVQAEPTGVWLEELTPPYYALRDGGAAVMLASIAGGAAPVDARSLKLVGRNEASVERYLADASARKTVAHTPAFTKLETDGFDAVFLPGGHGAMTDYPDNTALARLIEQFDRKGRIVVAVCHGPVGLVSVRKATARRSSPGAACPRSPTARGRRRGSTRQCRSCWRRGCGRSGPSSKRGRISRPS